MKLSILSNCILKSSSIKTHFRRAILTTSFYRIWGSFFKREQIEFYLKIFDFLLMKYSLIKRHWWNLTKRLIECPSILKKDNYSVSNRFSTFYFSKSFTWSSWLENFESTSCFLFIEKEKCSHFCEKCDLPIRNPDISSGIIWEHLLDYVSFRNSTLFLTLFIHLFILIFIFIYLFGCAQS